MGLILSVPTGPRIGGDPPQERSALPDKDEPMATGESAADPGPSATVGEISG